MRKIFDWLKKSHRMWHLIGGLAVGAGANGLYCAVYTGVGIAAALELKDWQWGGRPDWVDFLLTCAGVATGWAMRAVVMGSSHACNIY